MPKITNLNSIQVLDSRGTPTIRTFITLDDKYTGIATVPSGASTGKYEAVEIRDGDENNFHGKSINKCLDIIDKIVKPSVLNLDFQSLEEFDELLLSLDNTKNKSNLGGNTILSLSMSYCKALAKSQNFSIVICSGLSDESMHACRQIFSDSPRVLRLDLIILRLWPNVANVTSSRNFISAGAIGSFIEVK